MMNRYLSLLFLLLLSLAKVTTVFPQDNPDEFSKTIRMADTYFAKGDFINAKASYQLAVKLAPEDTYARQRLQLSLDKIKEQMQLSALFTEKVLLADELYDKQDLEGALQVYRSALAILPGDTYAAGRVDEIVTTLNERQLKEENYARNIALGDQYRKEGNLKASLDEFKAASALKPSESYPKEQITTLEKMIAEQRMLANDYESAIEAAEIALQRKRFDEAILQLEKAIQLRPDDNVARDKLAEAQASKTAWESYAAIVEQADNYYMSKEFDEAKSGYEQALKIKPEDDYPRRMLEKVEIALMDISKANRSSYEVAIARADKFYDEQEYDKAMEEYRNARRFYPEETYAQKQIDNINQALSVRKSQDDAYAQNIIKGDNLFKEQRYEEAKEEFNKAVVIKPMEQYPKVKVEEINVILAELKNQREIYASLVKGADKLFFSDNYAEARDQYRKALDMFPKEQYPQDQITMINEILGLRDKYVKSVTRADKLLADRQYDEALKEFREAAKIDSKDVYLQGRIYEIETLVAEQNRMAQVQRSYDSVLVIADAHFDAGEYDLAMKTYQAAAVIIPSQGYPAEKMAEIKTRIAAMEAQAAIDKQFNEEVSKADQFLASNELEKALQTYESALKIKPGEEYASGKAAEIREILGEIALKEALERQYEDAISKADKSLNDKDYTAALASYRAALELKPGESYPGDRISAINGILGEMAAQEAVDKQYEDAISYAGELFALKEYPMALAAYQDALKIKPEESLPQDKIREINGILDEIAEKNAFDKRYNDIVANADKLFAAKDYQNAMATYKEASGMKPDQTYPKTKMDEITTLLEGIAAREALDRQYADAILNADKLLEEKKYQEALAAYQSALDIKPGEQLPKDRISEINGALKEIADQQAMEKQYADAISNADKLLASKEYQQSLASYQEARSLKPGEQYPADRIAEITAIMKEIADKEALEQEFARLKAEGDQEFALKAFEDARGSYQKALQIKPDDNYLKNQLSAIDSELAILAEQAGQQKKYEEALAFAEKHLLAKDYENARHEFQVAAGIKPGESYPKDKIAEIDARLEEIARQKELDGQFNKLITEADDYFRNDMMEESRAAYQEALKLKPAEDYPSRQLIAINRRMEALAVERDKAYQVSVSKADNYFDQQEFPMAKLHYERALELKPEEIYPLDKLKVVNEEIMKRRQLTQAEYDKAVADADKFYASKIYDNAIESYRSASLLKPEEEYPKEMVRRILKLLSERMIVQLNKDSRIISNNTQEKFDFLPVAVKDRRSNYIFFRAKNLSTGEYKLIVNFGKGQTKNGGVVVKIPPGEDLHEYIIRISAQYKWFSDDNNWITFYPEGGDLEVFLVQISYSD